MRHVTIGRIWNIPIRLHISLLVFLPILAWLLGSGEQIGLYVGVINAVWPGSLDPATFAVGARSWTIGIAGAIGLFASVAIHELGHAWAGMRYGYRVESITLWLLGGLASFESIPREWDRELVIALAGPGTSYALAAGFALVLQVAPASQPVLVFVLGFLAILNVLLATFNLLPAFPMDGGRVLRALLARSRPYASATRTAARVGIGFAALFVIIGVLAFEIITLLLGLFIYVAATTESRSVLIEELLSGLTAGDLAAREPSVDVDTPVDDLLSHMLAARRTDLLVREGDTIVGIVTAGALRSAASGQRVGDIATTDLPRLDVATTAFDALNELGRGGRDVALVEQAGQPVGAISRADFAMALELGRGDTPP
ncbi:MAG: site-2 protease family protein [Salinirussus sp.]